MWIYAKGTPLGVNIVCPIKTLSYKKWTKEKVGRWTNFVTHLAKTRGFFGVSALTQNRKRLGARMETDPHLRKRFGRAESALNNSEQ